MASAAEAKGLPEQDLANLDVNTLTPLTMDVMGRQATINIGTIGHVAHGKSTVVKAISGVQVNPAPHHSPHAVLPTNSNMSRKMCNS